MTEQTPGRDYGLRRFRALVIDDERDFRHLMSIFLQRSGMPIDVEAVCNGAEALQRATAHPPDIILLDIMMPEMDGFAVCSALRQAEATRPIPILMLTALDEASDRTRGFLAGTDDYLAKPFDRGEFLARVRRILQRTYGYADPAPATAVRASL
ncbi:MAG: response regulator transcription factor [Candidatus Binatia bacterium]